jgi:hypothetical protein
MANYIGNQPLNGDFKRLDSIASSFDGSTTQFNLTYNTASRSVGDASQLIVSLNGVIQEPLNAYTLGIGGNSIIFASAPASGDTCHIVQLGAVGSTITPTDGSVTASKLDASLKDYYEDEFTADGSTTDFTLSRSAVGVNQLMVTVDGVVQPTSAYSASGTTFTISPALPNGTNIRVVHMGVKAGVYVPAQNSIGLNELDLTALDGRYYQSGDSINVTSITSENITADGIIKSARDNYSKVSLANTGTPYEYQVENNGSNFRITDSTAGQTRVAINTTGYVGIGTIAPAGRFHVVGTGGLTGGTVQNSGSGNQIVIENNASSGSADIQMLGPTNGYNHIFFGDADDANIGVMYYNHNNNSLNFTTNANTGFMMLDSAGSFLVGSTNSNLGSSSTEEGIVLNATGTMASSRSGNIASVFNRLSSDGHVVQIRRDGGNLAGGSNAGHLGVVTASGQSRLYLGNSNTSLRFNNGIDAITPCNNDGNDRDAAIDLGVSPGARFRDLYLTGGIQFDSRSNKLDDYEEGYFNYSIPCSGGGSFTVRPNYISGYYTKVGRLVTIHIRYETQGRSSPSGDIELDGLPFTVLSTAPNGGNASFTVPILLRGASSSSFEWDYSFHLGLIPGTTKGKFYGQGEGSSHSFRALQPGDIPSNFEGSIVATYLTT